MAKGMRDIYTLLATQHLFLLWLNDCWKSHEVEREFTIALESAVGFLRPMFYFENLKKLLDGDLGTQNVAVRIPVKSPSRNLPITPHFRKMVV